jgi:hypothetical protein
MLTGYKFESSILEDDLLYISRVLELSKSSSVIISV